eukprot:364475-Chlamydomonas_euryale.AAC.7
MTERAKESLSRAHACIERDISTFRLTHSQDAASSHSYAIHCRRRLAWPVARVAARNARACPQLGEGDSWTGGANVVATTPNSGNNVAHSLCPSRSASACSASAPAFPSLPPPPQSTALAGAVSRPDLRSRRASLRERRRRWRAASRGRRVATPNFNRRLLHPARCPR